MRSLTSRRVLFAPETFNLAEVTRGIEVARRTDTVCVFAGCSARYASVVQDAGFEFRFLRPELTDAQADQLLSLDQGRSLKHPFTVAMLAERVANERALIRELQPSAVVIGTTMSQLISARAENVPLVFVKPFAYSVPHVRQMRTTGLLPRRTRPQRYLDTLAATRTDLGLLARRDPRAGCRAGRPPRTAGVRRGRLVREPRPRALRAARAGRGALSDRRACPPLPHRRRRRRASP